jgi:dipeptidyl aminopeptidase/acylaminoacyl peptidase
MEAAVRRTLLRVADLYLLGRNLVYNRSAVYSYSVVRDEQQAVLWCSSGTSLGLLAVRNLRAARQQVVASSQESWAEQLNRSPDDEQQYLTLSNLLQVSCKFALMKGTNYIP